MTKEEIQKAIEDINKLPGDEREGAIAALLDIITAQQGGGGGLPPIGGTGEIEMDPDLEQPVGPNGRRSQVDIDDPDDVLKKAKIHRRNNQQEDDPGEQGQQGQEGQEQGQQGQQQGQEGQGQKGEKGEKGEGQEGQQGEGEGEGEGSGEGGGEGGESSGGGNGSKEGEGEDKNGQGQSTDPGDVDAADDDGVTYDYSGTHKELTDKEKKEVANKKKTEASRVAKLGRKALEKLPADATPETAQRIKELTEDLENIAKSTTGQLENVDWDQIRAKENELIDLINGIIAVNETPDIQARIEKVKELIDNPIISNVIKNEITADKRNDPTLTKKYGIGYMDPNAYSNMEDFKIDIKQCIDSQVTRVKQAVKTYSMPNKRHAAAGSPMVAKGVRRKTIEKKEAPLIAVFIDQSGSWGDGDVRRGKEAMSILDDLVKRGEIKVQYFFFSNNVHEIAADARAEGGTTAWPQVLKKIKEIGADNVVVMTDSDLASQSKPQTLVMVSGCVWWIWKGSTSARCTHELKGESANFQYKLR